MSNPMSKPISKPLFPSILNWLLGDSERPFHYIHHALLLAGVLMLLSAGIFNLAFQTAHPIYAWALIVLSPLNLLIWYRSRWLGEFNAMAIAFVLVVSLFNLPLNWFFNAGSDGPTLMFYFVMLLYVMVLLPNLRLSRYVLTAVILLMPIALIALEAFFADWVYRYPDEQARMADLLFSYIVVALVLLLIMAAYGKMYRLERDRAQNLAQQLDIMAHRDPLTGLFNRRALKQQFELYQADSNELSLALLDLDHFKQLNDCHGHDYGDYVLHQFSKQLVLMAELHQCIVTRHGGEEFILLIKQPLTTTKHVIQTLLEQCRQSPLENGVVTFSAGVVQCNTNESLDNLIQRADRYLYQAKNSGRNQICSD
ncbi:MAG: diguanylate cyclase [Thiomicrospira sp.]|nr:diguanylate cyclase [Thiomicrospira sp.]